MAVVALVTSEPVRKVMVTLPSPDPDVEHAVSGAAAKPAIAATANAARAVRELGIVTSP
ncbi:hypothetical protein GCM10017581_098110 [Dactylosporangium matsuzakiense]|uniref:Uncharacterized protein n=1 Tax=Dactylosporangium matsuzakiense TaxID=53360 RepID=A0A9W6NT62_9ACTN|nr:hypothetical protein GCM10017581_098110 [Dactylosporangium matsuzakiense]